MARVTYKNEIAALLVIDPENDFISEEGKMWDRIKAVVHVESHPLPPPMGPFRLLQKEWHRAASFRGAGA